MKILYTILFYASVSASGAQVPDWAWARSAGSDDADETRSIAGDASGNIFATGYFTGATFSVGGLTLTNGSAGSKQFFIAKYDRTGQALWARSAGGSNDDEGTSIAVDGTGNIYVCGNYQSTNITFGSSVLTNSSNPGQSDMFLVKYNPSGTVLWASSFGGGLQDEANGVTADASGNVYLTGSFTSLSVLFGSYGVVNSGLTDAFVAKINSSGSALWAKRIGGGQNDKGNDVAVDNSGNVYVTGDYNSATISSFSPALSNSGGFDVFLAKYDAAGNVVSGARFGGSSDESSTAIYGTGNGDYYVCGYFESATLLIGSTTLNSGGSRAMYVAKFNSSASAQWAQKITGSQNSYPRDITGDGSNIYITGAFDLSSVTFGSTVLNNGGSLDAFVVKYDASGSVLWARGSGATALDQSNAVAVSGGFVHIAGMYTSTLALRENNLVAAGGTDAFLTKLCLAPAAPLSAGGSTVCAGYPASLNATTPAGTQPVWFASATGGNSLHVGSPFSAVQGGTFYVASKDTNSGCGMYSTVRIPAFVSVYPAVNPSVSVTGHTLSASGNGSVVAWYDCNATATISGQTGSNYVLTGSGYFAVIMVSSKGCRDTSGCYNYSYTPGSNTVVVTPGIQENTLSAFRLSVFPNPSSGGAFMLRSNANTGVEIVNTLGMTIQRFSLDETNQRSASVGPLAPGIYFAVPDDRRGFVRIIVNN